jgi:hypothetical protein
MALGELEQFLTLYQEWFSAGLTALHLLGLYGISVTYSALTVITHDVASVKSTPRCHIVHFLAYWPLASRRTTKPPSHWETLLETALPKPIVCSDRLPVVR